MCWNGCAEVQQVRHDWGGVELLASRGRRGREEGMLQGRLLTRQCSTTQKNLHTYSDRHIMER